jgi:hypothetical protein
MLLVVTELMTAACAPAAASAWLPVGAMFELQWIVSL